MMFDKEVYKKYLEDTGVYSAEEVEDLAEKMRLKRSTIKYGTNVVHLDYFGGLLEEKDIYEIERCVSNAGLELSRYDKNGTVSASLDDYTLHVSLVISASVLKMILEHLGKNAAWEAVKASAVAIWRKVRGRNLQQSSANVKEANVGLRIKFEQGRLADFQLGAGLSEVMVLKVLDKVLEYAGKQNENSNSAQGLPDFIVYDEASSQLRSVDVLAELRRKAEAQATERNTSSSAQHPPADNLMD